VGTANALPGRPCAATTLPLPHAEDVCSVACVRGRWEEIDQDEATARGILDESRERAGSLIR
jgi:hypothetical protein